MSCKIFGGEWFTRVVEDGVIDGSRGKGDLGREEGKGRGAGGRGRK
jgi:hypothetical protein